MAWHVILALSVRMQPGNRQDWCRDSGGARGLPGGPRYSYRMYNLPFGLGELPPSLPRRRGARAPRVRACFGLAWQVMLSRTETATFRSHPSFKRDRPTQTHTRHTQSHADPNRARQRDQARQTHEAFRPPAKKAKKLECASHARNTSAETASTSILRAQLPERRGAGVIVRRTTWAHNERRELSRGLSPGVGSTSMCFAPTTMQL
jgi:hypothetical protein